MGRMDKLLDRIVRGGSDASIAFEELCGLLKHLGFSERIRSSHHIFSMDSIPEILNLQPKGRHAKPYQVKQVRRVLVEHGLAGSVEEEDL
jgi:hypothetical protein